MTLLISTGTGLLLGLGLLIWGLRERSARHEAERKAAFEAARALGWRHQSEQHAKIAQQLDDSTQRVHLQLDQSVARLASVRERLAQCSDPQVIKEWLDDELREELL